MDQELFKLFVQYIKGVDYLNQDDKDVFLKFVRDSENKKLLSFLNGCLACIKNRLENGGLQEESVSFLVDDKCHFIINNQEIILELGQAKKFLALTIDLFTLVYPLGTVFELKKSFVDSLQMKKSVKNIYVSVIERYAMVSGEKAYFQYVGTIYPVGSMGKKQWVHFNNNLIEKVIYKGYTDELEESYVLLMKREMLLHEEAVSTGFLEEEEVLTCAKKLGVKENGKAEY